MKLQASTRLARAFALAGALAALATSAALGAAGAGATDANAHLTQASPLALVLADGHVRAERVLALAASASAPVPPTQPLAGAAARAGLSFPQALAQLGSRGELPAALAASDRALWIAARVTLAHLGGTRRSELGAVLDTLAAIARAGELTPSRLPELMLTLQRNRQWWGEGGALLSYGQRVGFPGSGLVWEYYPGQGIQIQWLGSFGAANGLYDQHEYDALAALLDQAVSLAALRAGGIAWEYDFSFDGGSPPWVSAITEGTAVQALARAGTALGMASFLTAAHEALGIFTAPAPLGVDSPTRAGARYLIYSFAPHEYVINAFIQALVGLYDLASTGDGLAATLLRAGLAQARLDVPAYNTGYWSLYDQYSESSLSYHELLTGFLANLCVQTHETTPAALTLLGLPQRPPSGSTGTTAATGTTGSTGASGTRGATGATGSSATGGTLGPTGSTAATGASGPSGAPNPYDVFCTTASAFQSDLKQPPVLTIGHLARSRATLVATVPLSISKISTVNFAVSYAGRVVSQTSLQLAHGRHALVWKPPHAGLWTITIAAVDLAGNRAQATATVTILAPPPHRHTRPKGR